MGSGYCYVKKISDEEFIKGLDNILQLSNKYFSPLLKGNPSMITKYGENKVSGLEVDCGRQICLNSDLPGGHYWNLGVIRKNNQFKFCLQGSNPPIIGDSDKIYHILKKQFDLSTEYCLNNFNKSFKEEINSIFDKAIDEKIQELEVELDAYKGLSKKKVEPPFDNSYTQRLKESLQSSSDFFENFF